MDTTTELESSTALLTRTQRKVHDFIQNFFKTEGYSPTAKEIAEGIGIQSRGVVHRYLKSLADAGMIRLVPKRHRNIRLLKPLPHTLTFPRQLAVIGSLLTGQSIEAAEQREVMDVAGIFLGANRFAVRIRGDLFAADGFFDGDIAVCEHTESAKNGQIVLAVIDQQQAVLQRFRQDTMNTITLLSLRNTSEPVIYPANRIKIQGIYIGLIRLPGQLG